MSKRFRVSLILLLFIFLTLNGISLAQQDCKPCKDPKTNKNIPFSDVTDIQLDQSEVFLPCPSGVSSKSNNCKDDFTIGVRVSAANPSGNPLTYSYTVSGGRIVGQGANVIWDLSGVGPGIYTITAAVDNGCGFCGKTMTKTITVRECPSCSPACNCLNAITIDQTSSFTPIDESIELTAKGNEGSVPYRWEVSGADSIQFETQGNQIKIKLTAEIEGKTLTAIATAEGGCISCSPISESFFITIPTGLRGDVSGKVIKQGSLDIIVGAEVEIWWNGIKKDQDKTKNDGSFSFPRIIIPQNGEPYQIIVKMNNYRTNDSETALPPKRITIELKPN